MKLYGHHRSSKADRYLARQADVAVKDKENRFALIQEATRHAEVKLQAQLQTALAADQRASVVGGIYLAAGMGILAALATNEISDRHPSLLVGGLAAVAAFLWGAYYCIIATKAVNFDLPGNQPKHWAGDIRSGVAADNAMVQQLEHFDTAIARNNTFLDKNGDRFNLGLRIGFAAPIIGFAITALIFLVDSERHQMQQSGKSGEIISNGTRP